MHLLSLKTSFFLVFELENEHRFPVASDGHLTLILILKAALESKLKDRTRTGLVLFCFLNGALVPWMY